MVISSAKKRKLTLSLICFLSISLSSCYFFNKNFTFSNKISISTNNSGSYSDHVNYTKATYSKNFSKDNLNIDSLGYGYGYHYLPATGNSKILVIPIATSDKSFTDTELEDINTAFFGEADSSNHDSVASYYKKSSYSKLNITGEVTKIVKFNMTAAQLEKQFEIKQKNNENYTDYILNSALEVLDDTIDFAEYDSNGDGYIDAVWMVYAPSYDSSSDFYWAYTTWNSIGPSQNSLYTYDGVHPSAYSWASKSFLYEKKYQNFPDTHTYIHETGHLLGLDDYYSYDYDSSKNFDTPIGGIDMMDLNIGDHTSFSKYLLGWIEPTVVTPELLESNDNTFTLTSFTEKGKCLLIPIINKDNTLNYNNTAFDEYLLVEYYTPTNLNELDLTAYTSGVSTYQKPGVLLYHINARVGKIEVDKNQNIVWDGYVYDKLPSTSTSGWGEKFIYYYLYNNTASYSYDQSFNDSNLTYYKGRLISILPSSGSKIMGRRTGYSNDKTTPYRKGDSFSSNNYSNFIFDDGNTPKYSFTVTNTTSSDCKLTFKEF